jgi:hypothetical protein
MSIHRSRQIAIPFLGLLLPALLFFSSCCIQDPYHSHGQDGDASSPFLNRLPAGGIKAFSMHGISGGVEIEGVAGLDSIEIAGEREVKSDDQEDAREHLELLQVEIQKADSGIVVHTRQPNRSEGRTYTVEYRIRLPRNLRLSVELTNGEISVESVSGKVGVSSTNGNVTCRDLRGDCTVGLVNGQISCDLVPPDRGVCSLETVNGNVSLSIPASTSADLEAKVTNGTVSVSDLQINNLKSSRTAVSGVLGSGAGSIDLSTVNGNVTITGKK